MDPKWFFIWVWVVSIMVSAALTIFFPHLTWWAYLGVGVVIAFIFLRLDSRQAKNRARMEWERTHPDMRWDDWKHVQGQ